MRHRRALAAAPPRASPRAPATVVVAGTLLSGMSTIVVTPPAAAARVAVSNPSHSVRPGSLTWTCVSTMPGEMTRSPKSVRADRSAVASRSIRHDAKDLSALDVDGGGTDAIGQNDAAALDDQPPAHRTDSERVARLRNEPLPGVPTNFPSSMTTRPRDSTVSAAPVT